MIGRLITVRINRDPDYQVIVELKIGGSTETHTAALVLTDAEARELEKCLHYFFSDATLRSVIGDPNVGVQYEPKGKGGA